MLKKEMTCPNKRWDHTGEKKGLGTTEIYSTAKKVGKQTTKRAPRRMNRFLLGTESKKTANHERKDRKKSTPTGKEPAQK